MTSRLLPWRSLPAALLGVFFFGGLWWTVQKGVTSDLAGVLVPGQPAAANRRRFWLDSILFRRVIGQGSWRASLDF